MNADDTAKSPNTGAFKPTTPAAQQPGAQPASGTTPVRRPGVLPPSSAASAAGASAQTSAPASSAPRGFAPTGATPPSGSVAPTTGTVPPSGSVPQRSAFRPISDTTVAASAAAGLAASAPPRTSSVSAPVSSSPPTTGPDAGETSTVRAGALSLTDKMKGLTTRAKDGTRDQLEKADREQAAQAGTGPRKARVLVSRIDPWSVLKIGFLLSIAAGIMLVVAVHVLWNVLSQMGVFVMINEWVLKLFTADQELNILQFVAYPKVMSAALLIAVVDVVLLTGLATIAAFLYNTIARVVGGIYVTLTDD